MMVWVGLFALAVLGVLAAPIVLGMVLRAVVFGACLFAALALRGLVSGALQSVFPISPLPADALAIVMLYLGMRTALRRVLRRLGRVGTSPSRLQSVRRKGRNMLSVAVPVSLLAAATLGFIVSGSDVFGKGGLLLVGSAAVAVASLDMLYPRALNRVTRLVWRPSPVEKGLG